MPRKRDKKWKRQRGRGPSIDDDDDDDGEERYPKNTIEDDLKLQRIRRQERLAQEQRDELSKQLAGHNDDDENDDIGAEIPTPSQSSLLLPRHLMVKGDALLHWPSNSYTPDISSVWIHSIIQQSPGLSARRRARLGHWAASKHVLENLQMSARASTMYSKKVKWVDHALPNEMHCSWDMTCKHHLHPSARTLDVAAYDEDASSRKSSGLPAVATVLQGGWGLFQPPMIEHREPQIQTQRWYVCVYLQSSICNGVAACFVAPKVEMFVYLML
jgi:hypothetical protein